VVSRVSPFLITTAIGLSYKLTVQQHQVLKGFNYLTGKTAHPRYLIEACAISRKMIALKKIKTA
jgi:hypothetical protein